MPFGPAKPLFDLAFAPVKIGGRVLRGIVGFPGPSDSDLGTAGRPTEGEESAGQQSGPVPVAPPDAQRSEEPKPWIDDVALARKVETKIFRDPAVPKGKIDVNAAAGVVWLRGEAKTPDLIKKLERQTKSIPEVSRVENLLHLPKTPAPTRTDTPAPQRKTRRSKTSPSQRKVKGKKVTAEKRSRKAEPSPKQLSGKGRGRQPAPLGSGNSRGSGSSGGRRKPKS